MCMCATKMPAFFFKVTVHVGNIEIEIFAEYKYALNELSVTKIVFQ